MLAYSHTHDTLLSLSHARGTAAIETHQDNTATPETAHAHLSGSPNLEAIAGPSGQTWREYRQTLQPRYAVVWRDIAFCHLCLALGIVVPWMLGESLPSTARWWAVLPMAAWTGYWLHALTLFMHEAAHYLVHPRKDRNDLLADWIVCAWVGQAVGNYRKTHWLHHLYLGKEQDSEISYRHAPTARFILSTLTGWHLAQVLLRWRRAGRAASPTKQKPSLRKSLPPLARFAAIQVVILGACIYSGRYELATGWALGVFSFFPALVSLRTILEHRGPSGRATNRMFGTGVLARHFGAAGFNRHVLHHWDPRISYTRFDEMDAFLSKTPLASLLDHARSDYIAILLLLRRTEAGEAVDLPGVFL